jgi:two-component system, sensor histidine kinase and response regulator
LATEKIKILYVDDEQDNLFGFKATLRFHYQVFTAVNVSQAIAHLNDHPDIRIVFSDQRMPGQTGIDFFETIRDTHPLPVRILITAYTDVDAVIDAINKGNIFRYIKKPWDESDLFSAIEEANKFYLANSSLAVKHDELQKAYNELNRFAYSITHDVRGPISGLMGAIDVARDIADINEIKEMLYLMEKSLKKLDMYVLNMNDYYSLQRGELTITEIDFNELFEECASLFGVIAKVNGVTFNINVNQNELFRSDRVLLKLIIHNLLSNAFKYQDESRGEKLVQANIDVVNGQATISIMDSGIGILGDHIGEIFNLFYRATSQNVGSGFGLYNVKTALLKLNGHIGVTSAMNQGTTFKVSLPSI